MILEGNTPRVRERDESGVALILALFLGIMAVGLVVSGAEFLKAHHKKTQVNHALYGQAVQFARSGMTEAVNWFRRQTSQPVETFAPVRDLSANPQIVDTDDPDVGLVREFEISGKTWGRYAVWKSWPGDPDALRLAWRQQMECRDISELRGQAAAGTAWKLKCIGYVFTRNDPTKAFDESPNQVLAQEMLETEIQRLSLTLPGPSALAVGDGNSAHINTKGRIVGGASGGGITYPQGSGTPTTGPKKDNRVTGTPPLSPVPVYNDSVEDVFGMSVNDLRAAADFIVTTEADFPQPVQAGSIVFVEKGSAFHFDAAVPLNGNGIVYVDGNCNLNPGNNSLFTGILYVDGNLTVRAPSDLTGAIVATGNFTLQGSGDYATLRYDQGVLDTLRQNFGQYRVSGAVRRSIVR